MQEGSDMFYNGRKRGVDCTSSNDKDDHLSIGDISSINHNSSILFSFFSSFSDDVSRSSEDSAGEEENDSMIRENAVPCE